MKRVSFMKPQRPGGDHNPNVVHIEVPGATVNLTIALNDDQGREVTHVSVEADPGWELVPGLPAKTGIGLRVRKVAP